MSADSAPKVSIAVASVAQRPLIEGLAQFYIYDFSEMGPYSSGEFAFDDAGQFGPLPDMDQFWRRPGWAALVIHAGAEVAGFALVNTHSHLTGGEVERNMAEFFVARKFRRQGVAQEAVRQILAAYPGRWEIAVAERNTVAKAFWPRAIGAAPKVSAIVPKQGDGRHWRGPIWCFLAAG